MSQERWCVAFAASPVGALRWKPPAAVAAWTTTLLFARTGNATVNGTPRWPLYGKERFVMSLVSNGAGALIPAATLNLQHNCAFWNDRNRTVAWAPR